MNENQLQQGDVIGRRLDKLPDGCMEVKRIQGHIVVMHGESGHTHVIEDLDALFYEKDGKHYLVATKPVTLSHEEHHSQVIEPGVWEIGQVREKDWLSGLVAPVVD
jgi:hypothetical protein